MAVTALRPPFMLIRRRSVTLKRELGKTSAKTSHISLITALKNRKGKEKIKQNRHCYLYVG